jgi:pantoate--beta-alanine ligase
MRTLCSIEQVRSALVGARRDGRKIGLVPTMGAFHDGHLSLMRRAREDCDVVVVSLFVNPAQFNDQRDLGSYPRDEQRDAALAEQIGVDYLFMPSIEEIYPPGFATTVSVAGLTETLEGTHRGRAHFDAVTTVVAKLLNIVGPDVAYFGRKDAQQAIVVQRMVRDLDIPVRIELCPTVREPDGLAMSSRNVRLSGRDRARADALHRALDALAQSIAAGERDPVVARGRALAQLAADGLEPDYLELVSADTLTPLERIDGHPILALIAARVGDTRLIDNELIQPLPTAKAAGAINDWRT